ncbi:hypothetical protein BpHYR1_050681 [Brachionus plicatilis]|uniref:Uncharacterized protein n=1 Tax=Brachionus plicatilis TaxID=10195 RepID=A0A3M7PNR7_BRAPC|nr:hypothetical protein BpHYR1_050681 [Brachionus plicatilis]
MIEDSLNNIKFGSIKFRIILSLHKNDCPITNFNNNTTSFEQRISYYRSDDTDVEAEYCHIFTD